MRFLEVTENKKQYLDLLLLADEQEDMVDRYLDNGKMYVLDSKDFVFTGGEFGIESSIIALLGYVIVTLAAICMIKKKAKV